MASWSWTPRPRAEPPGEAARAPLAYAVTGLYFYDNEVLEMPLVEAVAARELEITDVNMAYLQRGALQVELLGRGMAGSTPGPRVAAGRPRRSSRRSSSARASRSAAPRRLRTRWIPGCRDVLRIAATMNKNEYGQYLRRLIEEQP